MERQWEYLERESGANELSPQQGSREVKEAMWDFQIRPATGRIQPNDDLSDANGA